ncbi:hypothetical protein PoB_001152100 [Plakobranchus ocellatus]|uniref:Uncharacterized protein n=1 Tax=Plakobranchus ocellatus TaxID=259542 RepID=A0AAV3YRK9_9GAST|nr:hypothetical protein PoB_001152100 [Plakobranchus ocellatus]
MCRPSDLAPRVGLFRNQVLFKPNGCLVVQFFGTKNDSDRHGFEVRIDPSSNPLTDPVSCLREYIEKTKIHVGVTGPLFVNTTLPYVAIYVCCTCVIGLARQRKGGGTWSGIHRSVLPTHRRHSSSGGRCGSPYSEVTRPLEDRRCVF